MADIKKIIEKEAAKQVEALAAMEAKLGKEAVRLQTELYRELVDKYLDALQTDEAGNILYNAKNLGYVNDLNKTWQTFQDKHYLPVINDFAKDLLSIVDIEATYFNAIGKAFDLDIAMEKTTDLISKQIGIDLKTGKLIEDSYLYRLAEGSQVKDDIANLVLQNISAKSSFRDLKDSLQTLVEGDETTNGAMQQYLRTYAYDTFANVQRSVDLNIADTYQFNSFIYSGDIIKDSREFCIERVNGIFTRDDLAEWSTMDWKGKNWDVPVEISLGGYNCRHTLMWIPDEAVEYFKEGGKPVKEEEVEEVEKLVEFPKDKKELVDFLNKEFKQNYKITDGGRIYQEFMGKKMYLKEDQLINHWMYERTARVVRENGRYVREYLKENGYSLISSSKEGNSFYYSKPGAGIVRISDHGNLSSMYIAPSVNVYSETPGAWREFIEQIKKLEN